jgi:hypothetical protein
MPALIWIHETKTEGEQRRMLVLSAERLRLLASGKERSFSVVRRHPMLYQMLSLSFFGITLLLISLGLSILWPPAIRFALFALSLFSFVLTLSYASLGAQEEHGRF